MSILILAVVLIPLLTALFLKVIGKFLNELLTNFITLNAAMLSVGVSFFLFGYIFFVPLPWGAAAQKGALWGVSSSRFPKKQKLGPETPSTFFFDENKGKSVQFLRLLTLCRSTANTLLQK